MYIPDLQPCRVIVGALRLNNPLAVGWLNPDNDYPQGSVDGNVIAYLTSLCSSSRTFSATHKTCVLCDNPPSLLVVDFKDKTVTLGQGTILVFSRQGRVYQAPDMIVHYISVHGYQPPHEFIDAVLTSPPAESNQAYEEMRTFMNAFLEGFDRIILAGEEEPD